MKKILTLLLTVVLLSAFFVTALADDDNAQSGDGNTHGAASGYAWYNRYQYLWKVTVFVGKTDTATKQSNLINDFHRVGTIVMKKSGWNVNSNVKFGNATKIDYYNGTPMTVGANYKIIDDINCPKIPIVCDGNIEKVKSYFGSTGVMSTILGVIADEKGETKKELLAPLEFTIDGKTKTGWDYSYVEPNATTNRVPWVIVYEPMVILNLKDKKTKLAFTATEFALCELNGWYDWNKSGGKGQYCDNLTEKHLPTSVQLEESWFGYPVYNVTNDSTRWNYEDVIQGGGWGMRWLSAIQEEVNQYYEFSVFDLKINPNTCYEKESVTVTFKTKSHDTVNSYNDIPLELLFNDKVIYTEYVDYDKGSSKSHSLRLNVGNTVGVNHIKIRINWKDHAKEINPNNNETSGVQLTVKPKTDLTIEAIQPNSDYREGMTVITSYRIYNQNYHSIIPSHNNTVSFESYYYNGSKKVVISSQKWKQAVIPSYENNLVYFKWTVPKNISGKTVYCTAVVNSENNFDEFDTTNNTATLIKTITKVNVSQTPDTQYEEKKPEGFTTPQVPSSSNGVAKWSLWTYSNGEFIKSNYGISISNAIPNITPDEDNPSAEHKSGYWYMKSGYGIYLTYTPKIASISGYIMPSSSAYTQVQRAEAAFPEFGYSDSNGSFRTLEKQGNTWTFVKNPNADKNECLHFTPLWYPDGNYTVTVISTDVWTPGGMISEVRNSNVIKIKGSAYDDWYVGE